MKTRPAADEMAAAIDASKGGMLLSVQEAFELGRSLTKQIAPELT